MGGNLETRSLLDEIRSFEKGGFFDFGHPLLNRIGESFIKAAGIGAVQAVSREAYFTAVEGTGANSSSGMPDITSSPKKHRFADIKGESSKKSLEALVKSTGKESLQWGFGSWDVFWSYLRSEGGWGAHDWKNSAVAGAVTGAALALTADAPRMSKLSNVLSPVRALSTAANLLTGIF